MKSSIPATLALAALLAVGASSGLHAQDAPKVERPSSSLITREQIADGKFQNAYDAVESLHSNWLVERMLKPDDRAQASRDTSRNRAQTQYVTDYNAVGKTAPGGNAGLVIYFDGTKLGGPNDLKTMRASEIWNIRKYSGNEAQGRFGIGHSSGVIYVTSLAYASKDGKQP